MSKNNEYDILADMGLINTSPASKGEEKAEQEKLAQEKAEQERLAKEKAEQERLAKEKAEQEKLAKEKAEQEKLAKEKAEQEKLAKEKAEQERLAQEKAEQERLAKEKAEQERLAQEKAEQERLAKEKAEQEKLAKEQAKTNKKPTIIGLESIQMLSNQKSKPQNQDQVESSSSDINFDKVAEVAENKATTSKVDNINKNDSLNSEDKYLNLGAIDATNNQDMSKSSDPKISNTSDVLDDLFEKTETLLDKEEDNLITSSEENKLEKEIDSLGPDKVNSTAVDNTVGESSVLDDLFATIETDNEDEDFEKNDTLDKELSENNSENNEDVLDDLFDSLGLDGVVTNDSINQNKEDLSTDNNTRDVQSNALDDILSNVGKDPSNETLNSFNELNNQVSENMESSSEQVISESDLSKRRDKIKRRREQDKAPEEMGLEDIHLLESELNKEKLAIKREAEEEFRKKMKRSDPSEQVEKKGFFSKIIGGKRKTEVSNELDGGGLEGRKKIERDRPDKKVVTREDIENKDIYEIELDKTDDDPNYDSYYEDVLVIDKDLESAKRSNIVVFGILGFILLFISVLIYMAIKSLFLS